ncbi:activity regulator of membrane protease YbbK [Salinivibrio sp. ML198]|uniref:Activity regulator of membrane protease YbbK n=1 Tax=Salinivibrio siamensis TaxID=414286 RepID=A0ABX3K5S0_9GAMM|nr:MULTISPECIES: NfeD family protein [Salinivibrio]KKA43877.1 activity regulator of membrane protease YbbK [Salinivibrio sp. KP-1]OOE65027.1 activity regulator of membrane protease YbbK [Salinivibrio sp. IB868]OOE73386.1 activity regulator of membrane protease YbbK [Salinivibrio sp. ML290]OOE75051.1 activity regulator of membrane protease YbbK [Salinivibrio sp. IB870]OOE79614.1 activity regulator of membrane protease YbbK [Salinivibrio sp. ML198]
MFSVSIYLAELTVIVGLLLLAVEVWLLGLSTIVLLATGVAAILVGLLAMVGVVPETVTALFSSTGIGAGLLTAMLWRPLKQLQRGGRRPDNRHSDFIGLILTLSEPLSREQPSTIKYSGVTWQLRLSSAAGDCTLLAGEQVKVVGVDVGRFTVEPILPE